MHYCFRLVGFLHADDEYHRYLISIPSSVDQSSAKSHLPQSFFLSITSKMIFQTDAEVVLRVGGAFAIIAAAVYFVLTHRLISSIPRGKWSQINPMGDVPALIRHHNKTGSVFNFVTTRCSVYGSPIIQLLLGGSNFVVVGDLRESYDVALRRPKEFGHATRQDKTFSMISKNATISMASHPVFWAQRKIWSGIMSTSFLHEVSRSSSSHNRGRWTDAC